MPKPILDRPRIVAFAGQGVATGMSEHVDVNLERQAGTLTDAFDKPIDGIRRKWATALGREHETAIRELPMQLPECSDLLATERVNRWLAVFRPPHMQRGRPAELDLRPFQIGNLDSPQAMPEGDQDQRGVPVTVAAIAGGLDQLLDFGLGQVFPGP